MRTMLICTVIAAAAAAFAVAGAGAATNVPFQATDTFASALAGGSGSVIQTVDTGSGIGTHVGRYTLVGSETVDLGALTVTNGSLTITAANGDTVNATYSGTILPGLTGYVVSGPITGGTGRFAGATGYLTLNGTFDPLTFTGSDVITGAISTVGSL
jgi:hypothetical protein